VQGIACITTGNFVEKQSQQFSDAPTESPPRRPHPATERAFRSPNLNSELQVCRRYIPCYCSLATDVRSHKAGGGDGASEAVVCDWLVGESNNPMDAHVA